ncbi:MAG: hypothetical protein HYU88_05885 [Chloroflexi bacterium]|nr:hypothetical protein [Chloroflexota bacterium]
MSRGLAVELALLAVAILAIFALGRLLGFLASLQMRLLLALLVLLLVAGLLLWRRFRSLSRRR